MKNASSKALTGFKYIYLVAFFTLLSGFFYPLINNTEFDGVFSGVFVLFVGLAGGALVYRAATSESNQVIFPAIGFGLMVISLYYIIQLTGRA